MFVANSRHVAGRIARYYGRSAEVVHPPIDVDHFLGLERAPEDFYLVFGRVVPYKRVDLAVSACERLGRKLEGGGRWAGDGRGPGGCGRRDGDPGQGLRGRAGRAVRRARALLFPGEEDFGIVPVEAQASGVPVIAYGIGGAEESVLDGRTGVLFGEQSAEALARAIERFEDMALDEAELRDNARRFGRERFRREMAVVIDHADRDRADRPGATSARDTSPEGVAQSLRSNARSASSATWRAMASEEVAAGEGALRTCRARSVVREDEVVDERAVAAERLGAHAGERGLDVGGAELGHVAGGGRDEGGAQGGVAQLGDAGAPPVG